MKENIYYVDNADYSDYWQRNSYWLHDRVLNIKNLLKIKRPENTKFIRLGSFNDGGYVVADDITSDDFVLSFGIDQNIDFEKDLSKYGCEINMYDYSIDSLPTEIPNSKFFKEKIGIDDGCTTLKECLDKTEKDIFFKMDIDGHEWNVLATATQEDFERCRQITMELHWMQFLEVESYYDIVLKSLENIRKTHTPVFLHPSNDVALLVLGNSPVPPVFEILYLRNSSYSFVEEVDLFAGLVNENNPNIPEVSLTFP